MKHIGRPSFELSVLLLALLANSCATQQAGRLTLPAETSMSAKAGRGDLISVTLNLEGGEGLLFLVDTGAPFILLDKSLEPKLGKPLGSTKAHSTYGTTRDRFYKAPRLYLGNTELVTGERIMTMDFIRLAGDLNRMTEAKGRLMGIIGMDCLKNYCIQLDFSAGKMRFLDPDYMGSEDLGRAFPLTISANRAFVEENLLGVKGVRSQIDTGCNFDGVTTPKLFQRWNTSPRTEAGEIRFPNGVFTGGRYTNVVLHGDRPNLIGLGFLGRHLVTLNFPKRTMYLKQTSVGPRALVAPSLEKERTESSGR